MPFKRLPIKDISFVGYPATIIGIRGNVKADSVAKSDLKLPLATVDIPYSAFKQCVS